MALSLYDVSVGSYLQMLGATSGYLEKGAGHCAENGIDLDEVVETRLWPDMLPFRFQVISVVHHSLGAIKGIKAGLFTPPDGYGEPDYDGLQKLVADARAELEGLDRGEIDALVGKDMAFGLGERKLPFVAEDFVLSFSLPNLYFHATTAYDILRNKGVPLGKRDFMGALRIKR
ncbi:MAG: DUF1993 domain-containing protein [Pseudomonadales bacterium]|jgi:hypothetical protein